MLRNYIAIFLVSLSVLILEVSLTRIFSISLWYHFAFLVISLAMLGTGCAGTLLSVISCHNEIRKSTSLSTFFHHCLNSDSYIDTLPLVAGVSIPACYLISRLIPFDPARFSWDSMQLIYLALYCLTLSIPFFFSAIFITLFFFRYSDRSPLIYSVDLLGAGTGSVAVLFLLNNAAPEYAVLASSLSCFLASFITGNKKCRHLTLIAALIISTFFISSPSMVSVTISEYKPLSQYLSYPEAEHLKTYYSSHSQVDTFRSPAAKHAPGLSLSYLKPLPNQTGMSIDGGKIYVITHAGKGTDLSFLSHLPAAAVYAIRNHDKALVIDPEGGLHSLMSQYFGTGEVHKVESNPLIVKVIREDFSDYSGNVYDEYTWTGYGRNYINRLLNMNNRSSLYDLVDIPMTGTAVSGIYGISEEFKYTVEAFKEYVIALNDKGMLSISLYLINPPRTEFRLLSTVTAAFSELGIHDISDRTAALRSWDSITMLFKKSPFNVNEIEALTSFASENQFDMVYYPGIKKDNSNIFIKLPSDDYYTGFYSILNTAQRKHFIDEYMFDIRPVYDDNPFFNHYFKLINIRDIYRTMGNKWIYFMEEGYLLPLLFTTVLLLSIVLIMVPVFFITYLSNRKKGIYYLSSPPQTIPVITYFAFLGAGFMFVEVSLIQQGILLLENPVLSVAVNLTAILISSGLGSMASHKSSTLQRPVVLPIVSLLVLIYSSAFPLLINALLAYEIKVRSAASFIALMPLGFFIGIPFPMGLKILGKKYSLLIPWAWSINSFFSVLAPILTVMIALLYGFQFVLWVSSLVYLAAFVSLHRLLK